MVFVQKGVAKSMTPDEVCEAYVKSTEALKRAKKPIEDQLKKIENLERARKEMRDFLVKARNKVSKTKWMLTIVHREVEAYGYDSLQAVKKLK